MSQSLTERYDERIAGVLSCYDRLVITGTLPVVCYAAGMTGYLNANGIRIFDYPDFAKTLRDRVRERAASLAAEAGVTIEHIAQAAYPQGRCCRAGARSSVATTRAWCTSSRPWKPAMPTSPGTTSRRTRPSSGRTAASACTTTSTSRTPSSGWSICGFRHGRRSACNSTAMAIAGWRAS